MDFLCHCTLTQGVNEVLDNLPAIICNDALWMKLDALQVQYTSEQQQRKQTAFATTASRKHFES